VDDLKFFRFSKEFTDGLMDGQLHLVRRGVDFPEVMANSDICRRLRNSAYYRQTKVTLTPTTDGILIQARQDSPVRQPSLLEDLAQQLGEALDERDMLEEALQTSLRSVWEKINYLEEELSLLKTQSSSTL